MRIGKIASDTEYRMDKQFQNWPIFGGEFWFGLENFKNF